MSWRNRHGLDTDNLLMIAIFFSVQIVVAVEGVPLIIRLLNASLYALIYVLTSGPVGLFATVTANKVLASLETLYVELSAVIGLIDDVVNQAKTQNGWVHLNQLEYLRAQLYGLKAQSHAKNDLGSGILMDSFRGAIFLGCQIALMFGVWYILANYLAKILAMPL